MAQPLPGDVDTGLTHSPTSSLGFTFKDSHAWALGSSGGQQPSPPSFDGVYYQDWIAYNSPQGQLCPPPDPGHPTTPGWQGRYEVWVRNTTAPLAGGTPDVQVHLASFGCQAQWLPGGQPADTFTGGGNETQGPFRLGAHIAPLDTSAPHYPQFWTNFAITYTWWADENTTKVSTFCGLTVTQYAAPGSALWSNTAHPGMTPRGMAVIGGMTWGCKVVNSDPVNSNIIAFSGLNVDGSSVDTSDVPAGGILPPSMSNSGPGTETLGASPPFKFTYDVDITKFGAGTTGARLLDNFQTVVQLHPDGTQKTPQSDFLTCPVANTYEVPITSWVTHKKSMMPLGQPLPIFFDIQGSWAAAQDPPLDSRDLRVPIWPNPAMRDPSSGNQFYAPVAARLATTMSVEFPLVAGDPHRASHWVINNPAYGSVTETGVTGTTFHVTDTRAVFTRTFAEHWRAWTQLPFPHGVEAYEVTQHDYFSDGAGDDIWGWESYGWLEVKATATGFSGSPVATLQVDGVHPEFGDPHTTGGDRETDFTRSEHPFSYVYAVTLTAGTMDTNLDLLFPATFTPDPALPVYPGRVDTLTWKGLPVGDFTLTDLLLHAREQGYLKNDYGPPVGRLDYSCIHASQDGSEPMMHIGDQVYKPDEIGNKPPYGGALRYVDPKTGSGTGDILDRQFDLIELVIRWDEMEGWTVTYDGSIYDAANKDSFGNTTGEEYASWMRPIAPHMRYATGGDFHPQVSPVVRQFVPCNAKPLIIYTRWPNWGAFEALVGDGAGGRAGAGVPVKVIRDDTGATVLTASTDVSGYATLSPVPANGVRTYHLSL